MQTNFSVKSYIGVPTFSSDEENPSGVTCSRIDFKNQGKALVLEGQVKIPVTMLKDFRSGVSAEWFFACLDGVWSLIGHEKQGQLHLEVVEWRERVLNLRKQQTVTNPKSFQYLTLWVVPSFLGSCLISALFYRLFPENNIGLGLGLMTFAFLMSGALVYLNHWGLWKDIPEIHSLEKEIKERKNTRTLVQKVA